MTARQVCAAALVWAAVGPVAACAGPTVEFAATVPRVESEGAGARRALAVRVTAGRLQVQVQAAAGALPLPPWVRLIGEDGAASAPTDASGLASFELAALTPAAFPFRATFATAACDGCIDAQVRLSSADSAALVLTRSRLDDFDAFLVVHPAAVEVRSVRAARRAEAERQRQAQIAAADAAAAALDAGDFSGAAAALQRCRAAEIEVLPRCRRLDGKIVQDFGELPRRLVDGAVALRRFDDAEAAVYRCLIVAREHPACATARDVVTAGRLASWLETAVDATHREGFARASAALAACLGLAPAHPPCVAQGAVVAQAEAAWRSRQVQRRATAAGVAWRRRRFAESRPPDLPQRNSAQTIRQPPERGHAKWVKIMSHYARHRQQDMPCYGMPNNKQYPELDIDISHRPGVHILNGRCSLHERDGTCVAWISGTPAFCFEVDDIAGQRYFIAQALALRIAKPHELAAAFNCETRTIHRVREAYLADGIEGLLPRKTGPKGPRVGAQREQTIMQLRKQGVTLAEIAERVHVSRRTVSMTLVRLAPAELQLDPVGPVQESLFPQTLAAEGQTAPIPKQASAPESL